MTYAELFQHYGFPQMCDVAQAAQMSKSHLSNIWYGHDRLGLNIARKLASATGVPIAELIDATPESPPGRRGRRRKR